jgi:hypothetical protein
MRAGFCQGFGRVEESGVSKSEEGVREPGPPVPIGRATFEESGRSDQPQLSIENT